MRRGALWEGRPSGPRRAYSSPARYRVWLKSEISLSSDRGAAKTGTGVAVHENLLDSVMPAAPLKHESHYFEQPDPMHGLNVDQSWQSENLDA